MLAFSGRTTSSHQNGGKGLFKARVFKSGDAATFHQEFPPLHQHRALFEVFKSVTIQP